jgi:hypothetical protein
MDENEVLYKQIMQKMIDDYGLTAEDIKTLTEFHLSADSGNYIPKLNKKAFRLLTQKMGIKPFEYEAKPDEFDAVIPLFRYNADKMEHYASGVLIEVGNTVYLLTASHVVEVTKTIYMPVQEDIVPVLGGCHYIPSNPSKKTNIDFAYIKIDSGLSVNKKKYIRILKLSEMDLNSNLSVNDFCVFTGYPHRKSKNKENIISTEFFEYVGSYSKDDELYNRYYCNKVDNLIIRYNFRDTTTRFGDNLQEVVSPEGISGGGIFNSQIKTKLDNDVHSNPKLIGIAHFYDRHKKIMIGTRIEYCLRFMAKHEKQIELALNNVNP